MKIDAPDPTKVEIALYKAITIFLKKEGREPFGIGPILDYLWKCSLEVMNLNVLYYGRDLERDVVTAELVQ
jgi:vacuolar-type H+-ATPase subunit C/Vma6